MAGIPVGPWRELGWPKRDSTCTLVKPLTGMFELVTTCALLPGIFTTWAFTCNVMTNIKSRDAIEICIYRIGLKGLSLWNNHSTAILLREQ